MAIANSDGSIILSTKVDTSGMEQGTKSLKSQAAKLAAEYRKAGMSQSEAFKKAWSEIERTKVSTDKATVSTKKFGQQSQTTGTQASVAIAKIGLGLKSLLTYFIGIQTVFAAIRFSGASAEFATQTEASVQRLVDVYGSASDAVGNFIDVNARALGMSKAAAASFSSVYGNLFSVWADQATNAQLTNEYLRMTAVVASKTGRTVEDVQERVRSGLLGNTEAIEDLGIFVNVKTIEMTDAFQRMADGKSWEQLDAYTQQQIRSMAILEQATAKYGDEVAETSATIRNEFRASYQDFQNSWGNIVNTVLLPTLQVLTQIFNIATAGLNALSGNSGKILENAQGMTDTSSDTAQNIQEQTQNQKELNKELKKSLAGFDDIQILSEQTAENTSDSSLDSGLQGAGGSLNATAPDDSAFVNETNAMLTAIMGFVSVAMVAIGVILLLTGQIGWGLGFIIAGAGLLAVTQASVSQEGVGIDVQNALTTALLIAGVAAIVIGIILCMCQRYVKGIALIALGAATVVGDIVVNWDSIKDMLSDEKVATWVAVGGTLAIVLGILLCFAQQWGLGIGLIALGATALGVDVAVNWDAIKEALTDEKIAGGIALAGDVVIVLGILLCFVNLPLGIALIAAGVASLVTVVTLNWDAIKNKTKKVFNAVIEWVQTYGMLVLGILLVLSGIGIGAGIKIIWDWLSNSAESGNETSRAIVDWVKGIWADITDFWDKHIAPIFTAQFWLELAKKCGNGLINGFESAINGIIGMFEKMINWIVDGINNIGFDIPDWLGGGHFGFDIPRVSFGRVSIPRLAQGAVIPANREFLAVLGDQKQGVNIEAPLQTIVDAFNMALQNNGGYNANKTEVVLEIDGREFGRAVVEQGNKESRRIGTRLVIA